MQYSIIVPAHNEGDHIEAFVTAFIEGLDPALREIMCEIILVENGSSDNTLEACNRLRAQQPELVRVLSLERGSHGEAIKHGMLESRGTHLSILECDVLLPEFCGGFRGVLRCGRGRVHRGFQTPSGFD